MTDHDHRKGDPMADETMPCTDDWPTTAARFVELFADHETRRSPRLPGRNFMTDEILGYVMVDDEPVEISTGWFLDHRIFGVTYAQPDGMPDNRSKCCYSLDEVHEYLYGGSEDAS